MQQVETIDDLKQAIKRYKTDAKTIAFVPTMGNLHQGHLSLVDKARELADIVVASIFVNPLQFGVNEDLSKYPRTLENDLKQLKQHQCDLVYIPSNDSLITTPNTTHVLVPDIGKTMEDDMRTGHLGGVATIITKLFNLVQPNFSCFGKKDYQQWLMVKKLVADLNIDVDIIGCETVRENDGLAMSSRNRYLTTEQRRIAHYLRETLLSCAQEITDDSITSTLKKTVLTLNKLSFTVDYLELRQQDTLAKTDATQHSVLLCTARLGSTRLLDNIEIN